MRGRRRPHSPHAPAMRPPPRPRPARRVEGMEAQLQQFEDRGRDRAVALRAILRDDKMMETLLGQHEDGQLPMPVRQAGRRGGPASMQPGPPAAAPAEVRQPDGLPHSPSAPSSRPAARAWCPPPLPQVEEDQEPWDSYRNRRASPRGAPCWGPGMPAWLASRRACLHALSSL